MQTFPLTHLLDPPSCPLIHLLYELTHLVFFIDFFACDREREMYDLFWGDGVLNVHQGFFGCVIFDVRNTVTFAAVTTAFFYHFGDQSWKYSSRFISAFFVSHKRWIVEPVCCDILWTRTFCCKNEKAIVVFYALFYLWIYYRNQRFARRKTDSYDKYESPTYNF